MGFESLIPEKQYDNAIVVDNSIAMRWLFDDGSATDRKYSQKVLDAIETESQTVLVPYLWIYEAANVVNYYVTKMKLDDVACKTGLDSLMDLFLVMIGREHPSELYEFAQVHNLSTYDSAYLLLARQQHCPIATLDKKMKKVAKKIDVSIL